MEKSLNETLERMKERLAADLLFKHKKIQAEFAVRGRSIDGQVMSLFSHCLCFINFKSDRYMR